MKKIFFAATLFIAVAACETPNGVIGNPNGATNTTGTTGSANITNGSTGGTPVAKTTPGTPTDSSVVKKDSLPR